VIVHWVILKDRYTVGGEQQRVAMRYLIGNQEIACDRLWSAKACSPDEAQRAREEKRHYTAQR
jgi:hypothetical protein